MALKLTSYDIPQELRDRINAMSDNEIRALQLSVKVPADFSAAPTEFRSDVVAIAAKLEADGRNADLTIWWACENALRGNGVPQKRNPLGLSDEGYASLSQMLKETQVPLPPSESIEADLNSD